MARWRTGEGGVITIAIITVLSWATFMFCDICLDLDIDVSLVVSFLVILSCVMILFP